MKTLALLVATVATLASAGMARAAASAYVANRGRQHHFAIRHRRRRAAHAESPSDRPHRRQRLRSVRSCGEPRPRERLRHQPRCRQHCPVRHRCGRRTVAEGARDRRGYRVQPERDRNQPGRQQRLCRQRVRRRVAIRRRRGRKAVPEGHSDRCGGQRAVRDHRQSRRGERVRRQRHHQRCRRCLAIRRRSRRRAHAEGHRDGRRRQQPERDCGQSGRHVRVRGKPIRWCLAVQRRWQRRADAEGHADRQCRDRRVRNCGQPGRLERLCHQHRFERSRRSFPVRRRRRWNADLKGQSDRRHRRRAELGCGHARRHKRLRHQLLRDRSGRRLPIRRRRRRRARAEGHADGEQRRRTDRDRDREWAAARTAVGFDFDSDRRRDLRAGRRRERELLVLTGRERRRAEAGSSRLLWAGPERQPDRHLHERGAHVRGHRDGHRRPHRDDDNSLHRDVGLRWRRPATATTFAPGQPQPAGDRRRTGQPTHLQLLTRDVDRGAGDRRPLRQRDDLHLHLAAPDPGQQFLWRLPDRHRRDRPGLSPNRRVGVRPRSELADPLRRADIQRRRVGKCGQRSEDSEPGAAADARQQHHRYSRDRDRGHPGGPGRQLQRMCRHAAEPHPGRRQLAGQRELSGRHARRRELHGRACVRNVHAAGESGEPGRRHRDTSCLRLQRASDRDC